MFLCFKTKNDSKGKYYLTFIFLEIETLLKKEEAELEKQLKAKDPAAIAQLYHPDAVLVHRGVKTSYGREG